MTTEKRLQMSIPLIRLTQNDEFTFFDVFIVVWVPVKIYFLVLAVAIIVIVVVG